MKPTQPPWFIKDFHVLYRAAEAAVKATRDGPPPGPEHVALQVHLTRLRPAFELCEAERRELGEPRPITHELVPEIDPDAYALEVEESPHGAERRVTNRCRHPLVVVRKGAPEPEPLGPGATAVLGPEDYVAQPVAPAPAGGLRKALEHDRLYEAVIAAAMGFVDSWEDNEAVPDADELPAERALYDAAVALRAFEIDAKLAAERRDDHDEPTLTRAAPSVLDGGMRVERNDGELGDVVYQALATTSPPFPIPTSRAIIEALAQQLGEIPEPAMHRCDPSPRLAPAIIEALIAHPHVADANDVATAGEFLAHALRGAQLGWHVRNAHPADVRHVASIGAPMHEPHRSAWLEGYRVAVDTIVAPFNLTDALRCYHDSHLAYRAPEQLTARERQIIAAVEAERAAAAGDPEALAAHAFGGQGGS